MLICTDCGDICTGMGMVTFTGSMGSGPSKSGWVTLDDYDGN